MLTRVELRDKDFNLLEILDNEVLDLSWAYARIGGCGEFRFTLPRKLYEEKSISGDFNIRIYKRNESTDDYDLRYQGLVENKYPTIAGNSERIEISGHGYQSQLKRMYVEETYTSTEVSLIVKDILDTYITPYTNIAYSASDIEATTFTPDTIDFNTDALSALQTLADIVGGREWGVDKNRNFYFKAKSAVVGFRYPLGGNVVNFQEDLSFSDIANRVIIQGAQVGGTNYKSTYNDTVSQLKYNIRTKVIQNSSVTTDSVASQFANSVFSEFSDVLRKSNCQLIGVEAEIEGTTPIPLLQVLDKGIFYGTRRYGTFLYSGLINRQVNRINYSVNNNSVLSINLDLDQVRPTLAEQISQLEYQLEQQRSSSL